MFSRRDADKVVALLRIIADRVEADPSFLEQLSRVRSPAAEPLPSDASDGQDLIGRYHDAGPERFRDWLAEQGLETLQSSVVAGRFDTTGKVRRWKEKERVLDFLYREVERRAKFGRTILPAAAPLVGKGDEALPVQEPDQLDKGTSGD
jgi:hypothetical protein